jgi:hypothetical protein
VPLIEIRALPQPAGVDLERVLAAVTHAVAAVLGEGPRGTWATWTEIPFERYSEGGVTVPEQPADTHPPIVRIAGVRRPDELVGLVMDAVSGTITSELGLAPGNAFVRYEEVAPERLRSG